MIQGKRILLRPISLNDLQLCSKWAQDEEVIRHVFQHTKTEDEEKRWIQETLESTTDHIFMVILKESGIAIGNCGIHEVATDEALQAEEGISIGILIGEKVEWGKGYGSETVELLSQYIHKRYAARRVWLRVDTLHERAIKAYEKAGFRIAREIETPKRMYTNGRQYIMERLFV